MSENDPEWTNALNDSLSLAKRVARQVETARFLEQDNWGRFMDVICSQSKSSDVLSETLFVLKASLQSGTVLSTVTNSTEFVDCFLALAQLAEILEDDHRTGSYLGEIFWKELRALVKKNGPALEVFKSPPLPETSSTIPTYKEKLLNMPLEEKRQLYACKTNFTTLSSIPTWQDFASRNDNTAREDPKYPVHGEMNAKVSLFAGDITTLEIDAIVSSYKTALRTGGGVNGAIHQAAGPALAKECRGLKGLETGKAKITGGYLLPAKYVIQVVGADGKNSEKMPSCYKHCLKLLLENGLRTIGFPCLSTGACDYSNRRAAASAALKTVRVFLQDEDNLRRVDRIIFCVFLPVDLSVYKELLPVYFPT